MAQIDITLLGRKFPVGCKDGDEGRVDTLAQKLDIRLSEMKQKMPHVNDANIMALNALVMADQLEQALPQDTAVSTTEKDEEKEQMIMAVANVAEMLEILAEKLEKA